jgi:hypothetical protein
MPSFGPRSHGGCRRRVLTRRGGLDPGPQARPRRGDRWRSRLRVGSTTPEHALQHRWGCTARVRTSPSAPAIARRRREVPAVARRRQIRASGHADRPVDGRRPGATFRPGRGAGTDAGGLDARSRRPAGDARSGHDGRRLSSSAEVRGIGPMTFGSGVRPGWWYAGVAMVTAPNRGRDPAEHGLMRLLYRDWHPTRLGRLVNRVMAWRASAGRTPESRQTLEVRGRMSGRCGRPRGRDGSTGNATSCRCWVRRRPG